MIKRRSTGALGAPSWTPVYNRSTLSDPEKGQGTRGEFQEGPYYMVSVNLRTQLSADTMNCAGKLDLFKVQRRSLKLPNDCDHHPSPTPKPSRTGKRPSPCKVAQARRHNVVPTKTQLVLPPSGTSLTTSLMASYASSFELGTSLLALAQ